MNKRIILLGLAVVFIAAACNQNQTMLTIGTQKIQVEIADSAPTRSEGLSNRETLAANTGMLFIFQTPGKYPFWMKNMKFDLDFIWIKDERVVEITPSVSHTNTDLYTPKQSIDQMLEVNAGFALKHGIKVGDRVELTR